MLIRYIHLLKFIYLYNSIFVYVKLQQITTLHRFSHLKATFEYLDVYVTLYLLRHMLSHTSKGSSNSLHWNTIIKDIIDYKLIICNGEWEFIKCTSEIL